MTLASPPSLGFFSYSLAALPTALEASPCIYVNLHQRVINLPKIRSSININGVLLISQEKF